MTKGRGRPKKNQLKNNNNNTNNNSNNTNTIISDTTTNATSISSNSNHNVTNKSTALQNNVIRKILDFIHHQFRFMITRHGLGHRTERKPSRLSIYAILNARLMNEFKELLLSQSNLIDS